MKRFCSVLHITRTLRLAGILRLTGILTFLLIAFQYTFAQTAIVRGVVKDAGGNPLAGASVTIEGGKTGTGIDRNRSRNEFHAVPSASDNHVRSINTSAGVSAQASGPRGWFIPSIMPSSTSDGSDVTPSCKANAHSLTIWQMMRHGCCVNWTPAQWCG